MKKIVVIGSLNIDLVSQVPHLPKSGETITSTKFQTNFGGKGANQAVAAAKLGGDVAMIGRVGTDDYGDSMLANLKKSGVDTIGVEREDGTTGLAFINVSHSGENNIVLVPGANKNVSQADIDKYRDLIDESSIIIMQLEIPEETVEYVIKLAKKTNKDVILNPAPAIELRKETLKGIHTVIPNETELEILTGMPTSTENELLAAGNYLKSLGVKRVIVTAGEKGSYIFDDDGHFRMKAYEVPVVDTTAAGDSYIASYAVATINGLNVNEAVKFASKVAGLVVTREGAQSSLPTLEEVEAYNFKEE